VLGGVRQLWDYLDHAVSPEDHEKVEQHLSFWRRCCGELESAKEVRSCGVLPEHVRARLERFVADLQEDR
jgi:putative zinc finger protein